MTQILLQDQDGVIHNLHYRTPTSSPCDYANLTEVDKNKIEQALFLRDKFCVGDEVYNALSMIIKGMPKSYLVKQSRSELNKTSIERTPGD